MDTPNGVAMPNYSRVNEPPADDLDVASRVMETVQKQIASYQSALETLRRMRHELADRQERAGGDKRLINTPELFAELLQERGIPQPLSKAMAAEDFQDAAFEVEAAIWTWDCCCTHCCLTCDMATQVTGCSETFIW